MAVKPATGEVLVEEKRTRLETASNPKDLGRETLLPIWDFVDSMDSTFLNRCEFTIYRGRAAQKAEEKMWIGKFYEKITPDIVQQRWGGGEYNVWMKVPVGDTDKLQLKYNVDLKIEGTPKIGFAPAASTNGSASSSEIGQVLAMMREDRQMFMAAIERLSGAGSAQSAVQQALQLNGQVFSAAMPAVVKTLEGVGGGSHGSSPMDELTRQFMAAAIQKMVNPADPIESFTKMANAMGALGFKTGGNNGGGLATELARGLMNALPQLTSHVAGIMDQYRRAEEAKLLQVQTMRGVPGTHVITQPAAAPAPQPAQSNVIEMQAPPADPQAAPAAGNLTQEQTMQAEQLFQFVETKVAELLRNTDLTPEEAANDALTFIDVTDKHLVDELLRHGEPGLRWAFSNREILKQVPQGPRLDAFIAEFIKNSRKVAMPIPPMPDPSKPVA
jgi:hypothetical protein